MEESRFVFLQSRFELSSKFSYPRDCQSGGWNIVTLSRKQGEYVMMGFQEGWGEHPVSHPRVRHGRPSDSRAAAGAWRRPGRAFKDDWLRRAGPTKVDDGLTVARTTSATSVQGDLARRGGRPTPRRPADFSRVAVVRLVAICCAHPARRPPDARLLPTWWNVRPRR